MMVVVVVGGIATMVLVAVAQITHANDDGVVVNVTQCARPSRG